MGGLTVPSRLAEFRKKRKLCARRKANGEKHSPSWFEIVKPNTRRLFSVNLWLKLFLRRRAAPALLIQKPEFQTIKCPSVSAGKKRAKHPLVSTPARQAVTARVIFQSIFKVPKKLRFAK